MAILKRLYKTKTAKVHEAYQKYVKKTKAAGKKPHTFKYWSREPVYFRGVQAVERKPVKKLHKPMKKLYKPMKKLYKPKKKQPAKKPTFAEALTVKQRMRKQGFSEERIKRVTRRK